MTHVSLAFAKKKDAGLLTFGEGAQVSLVKNAVVLADCPVAAAVLDAANQDFSAKLAAMKQGGTTATENKTAARAVLIGLLRQIAAWLEHQAQGNPDLITLAGFETTTRGYHAQTPLATPVILAVLNRMTTQLQLRVAAVKNARSYEVQYRVGNGPWISSAPSAQARVIVVANLVPGTLYQFRVRAIGGSTGYSDWSFSVTHMCM